MRHFLHLVKPDFDMKPGVFSLWLWVVGIGAALGTAGVLVAWTVGKPLLTALYRPEYAQASTVFVWAMAAAGLNYVANFLGYGLTATRQFLVQAPLFATVTLATIGACALLVPRYGILGAAWALLVAGLVQVLGAGGIMLFTLARGRRAAASQAG